MVLFSFLIYYNLFPLWFFIPFIFLCLVLSLIYKKHEIPGIRFFMRHLEREENLKTFPGKANIYFLTTCIILVSFFSKEISAASVMILAVGDSVSFLIGYFGKLKSSLHEKKNIEGFIAGVVGAGFAASIFVPLYPAFVAAVISLFFEFSEIKLKKRKIDDNFYVPLISAIVLVILI